MAKHSKIALLISCVLSVGITHTMATRAAQAGARGLEAASAGTRGISIARFWRGRPTAENVTVSEAQQMAQFAVNNPADLPKLSAINKFLADATLIAKSREGSDSERAKELSDFEEKVRRVADKNMLDVTQSQKLAEMALANPANTSRLVTAFKDIVASDRYMNANSTRFAPDLFTPSVRSAKNPYSALEVRLNAAYAGQVTKEEHPEANITVEKAQQLADNALKSNDKDAIIDTGKTLRQAILIAQGNDAVTGKESATAKQLNTIARDLNFKAMKAGLLKGGFADLKPQDESPSLLKAADLSDID